MEIPVDLGSCGDSRHLEFIFLTEVGKVSLLVNIVEEIYLPKE